MGSSEALFVLGTDAASNRVTVGPRASLETSSVRIRGARLHRGADRVNAVRLRYHSPKRRCTLQLAPDGEEGDALIALDEPADGAAPGQLACLLAGDVVVGHGTIA